VGACDGAREGAGVGLWVGNMIKGTRLRPCFRSRVGQKFLPPSGWLWAPAWGLATAL
jgi:hypothetical protein